MTFDDVLLVLIGVPIMVAWVWSYYRLVTVGLRIDDAHQRRLTAEREKRKKAA